MAVPPEGQRSGGEVWVLFGGHHQVRCQLQAVRGIVDARHTLSAATAMPDER